jgi:hypothetical protein
MPEKKKKRKITAEPLKVQAKKAPAWAILKHAI